MPIKPGSEASTSRLNASLAPVRDIPSSPLTVAQMVREATFGLMDGSMSPSC